MSVSGMSYGATAKLLSGLRNIIMETARDMWKTHCDKIHENDDNNINNEEYYIGEIQPMYNNEGSEMWIDLAFTNWNDDNNDYNQNHNHINY